MKFVMKSRVAIIGSILIVITLLMAMLMNSINATKPIGYTVYRVRSNDNLWTIAAEQSNGYGEIDTRFIIDEIVEKSDIENPDMIQSGQTLIIPQYAVED